MTQYCPRNASTWGYFPTPQQATDWCKQHQSVNNPKCAECNHEHKYKGLTDKPEVKHQSKTTQLRLF